MWVWSFLRHRKALNQSTSYPKGWSEQRHRTIPSPGSPDHPDTSKISTEGAKGEGSVGPGEWRIL